jgi:hypothetical protein
MHEVYEHNPGDHEDPLPGPTWILGILGSVLLGVVVLGVTALFFNADERMISDKTQTATYPQFETLKEEQLAKLQGPPRKVEVNENDKVVETVVIPIDLAMQKVAERATSAPAAGATSRTP